MGFIVKFSEITLGMAYRERDPETGKWHGGFYWYVRRGLGKNWKWLGIIWAIILGCAMVFAPAVQINSVVESVRTSFDIPPIIIGVISAVLMFIVLIGGIKSLSHFAEVVVPFMALAYTVVSIIILIMSAGKIPGIFGMIFQYAFTPMAATGGFAGSTVVLAIRWGLARGVYSNEAGTGMAPLAHSSSSANHPVKQGLWGITEVFVDTIVVCTMTAGGSVLRSLDFWPDRCCSDRHCVWHGPRQSDAGNDFCHHYHRALCIHHGSGECLLWRGLPERTEAG